MNPKNLRDEFIGFCYFFFFSFAEALLLRVLYIHADIEVKRRMNFHPLVWRSVFAINLFAIDHKNNLAKART